MTKQTISSKSLGRSPAGLSISRLCTLTLAAILAICGTVAGYAQAQPEAPKAAKPVVAKKPATEPAAKIVGGYQVHQMIDLGGRITERRGSKAMWSTMVNQTSGTRVLAHSLEMHSVDPSKTHFFDTLSSSSGGYGGDPYDTSYLKMSKGRLYDFTGSFRRDRNYFDYNLLANSLLGPTALVQEPDSLHVFNTVRRNTDTMLTLFPVSMFHVRLGFNHGTHEGPSYSTMHNGGDVQLLQWFRAGQDTYTGGLDFNLAKRTTLSYDQFYVLAKDDTSLVLTGANYNLPDGTPVSLGVDTLATAKCGTAGTSNNTLEVVNGIVNPFCSGSTTQTESAPIRTTFPTEQLRFASHYWDKIGMNGRILYSGGTSNVNSFNETFIGFSSRTLVREAVDTGALGNGKFATAKRINVNADYDIVAELSPVLSVSDAVSFWDFRIPGNEAWNQFTLTGTATVTKPKVVFGTSMLTPLNDPSLTATTTNNTDDGLINQKNIGNTVMANFTVAPQVKLSAGWRINSRKISNHDDNFGWIQNWILLGMVMQPSHSTRLNLNYEQMNSKAENSSTPTNTYVREAPNKSYHLRARATAKPDKRINFAVTGNGFWGKNDDPLVNHLEHNYDISFATQIVPTETVSFDFSIARDVVYSRTDLCFLSTATPVPNEAQNAGTCVPTAANPTATSNLLLGNGLYDAPSTFISGMVNWTPNRRVRMNGGARVTTVSGNAEMLSPLQVPGALQSQRMSPFADLQFNIASQWAWHAGWDHQGYSDSGGFGPAARNFHGDIVTLGVKYAF
jgi:hypothetical protein